MRMGMRAVVLASFYRRLKEIEASDTMERGQWSLEEGVRKGGGREGGRYQLEEKNWGGWMRMERGKGGRG